MTKDRCTWHNDRVDQLEAFRTFVAVAEHGGFAAAARKLGRSPAAVTRTIAALEGTLGAALFRRTTRVVTLTDAGARFLVDARRILADVDESTALLRGSDGALRGPLVVTASVMFGRIYVVPLLLDFMRANREIQVRLLLLDRVVDLVDEGVDVAFRIAHLRDSSLRALRVGSMRRVFCAAPSYLARHGRPRRPADLHRHELVGFADDASPREWSFPRGRGTQRIAITPRFGANSIDATIAAALAGQGIVRAHAYQVADAVRAGKLELVLTTHEPKLIPVHVVHAAGPRAPARVRAFVDFAAAALRSDPRLDPAALTRVSARPSRGRSPSPPSP
jgi:DNA-binding transcriptional LysR family regulator